MSHVKVNSDLILLGDVELEAEWRADGLLAVGAAEGVRLILDAEAVDRLADLLDQHRRPRPAVRLRAVEGGVG